MFACISISLPIWRYTYSVNNCKYSTKVWWNNFLLTYLNLPCLWKDAAASKESKQVWFPSLAFKIKAQKLRSGWAGLLLCTESITVSQIKNILIHMNWKGVYFHKSCLQNESSNLRLGHLANILSYNTEIMANQYNLNVGLSSLLFLFWMLEPTSFITIWNSNLQQKKRKI